MAIHSTAIVSDKAKIHSTVDIGPYCIVEEDVTIGSGTKIESHVVVGKGTSIGQDCNIFPHVTIGLAPQDLSYKGEHTKTIVGDRVTCREFCTIHRGSSKSEGYTKIGNDVFLMNYVHIGHDCIVGNHVIIANGTNLGGHVTIQDRANISALFLAHQFVEIGELTIISGHSGARKSIPPFVLAEGRPTRIMKVNTIGLQRAGFSKEEINLVAKAYKLIRKKETKAALQEIEEMGKEFSPLKKIVDFYKNSQKGVAAFYSLK